MRTHGLKIALLIGAAMLLLAPAAAAQRPHAQHADPADLADHTHGPDVVLTGDQSRRSTRRFRRAQANAAYSGGRYTTSTGEQVTVYRSERFAPDDSVNRSFAEFLVSLVHNFEVERVTAILLTNEEIAAECGSGAVACYDPRSENLFVNGEVSNAQFEADAAHEYGHHIQNNRSNEPWSALGFGTKYWASYEGICPGWQTGELHPDATDPNDPNYALNPAEGHAEAYSVLNGGAGNWASIVDQRFYPDNTALQLLRLDVTDPWTGNSTEKFKARLNASRRTRKHTIETPADGEMVVKMSSPGGANFDLKVSPSDGIISKSSARRRREKVRFLICGEEKVKLKVKRRKGAGKFKLKVSLP